MKTKLYLKLAVLSITVTLITNPGFSQQKREQIADKYKWNLTDIYKSDDDWSKAKVALSSLVTEVPSSTYNTFANAEMPSLEVTLSDGKELILTQSEYTRSRTLPNRTDRQIVYKAFWNNWEKYKASYGEMLYGNVNKDMFNSKARHYSSSLEASLFPNNIPAQVYTSLVDNVNRNLPALHRYLAIKKRMLGVDTLKYSDLYVSVVKNIDLKYTYEYTEAASPFHPGSPSS